MMDLCNTATTSIIFIYGTLLVFIAFVSLIVCYVVVTICKLLGLKHCREHFLIMLPIIVVILINLVERF